MPKGETAKLKATGRVKGFILPGPVALTRKPMDPTQAFESAHWLHSEYFYVRNGGDQHLDYPHGYECEMAGLITFSSP